MPTGGGTVFKLTPNADRSKWKLTILYTFCFQPNCADGVSPIGGLTYQGAQSGLLYDGASPLYGVVSSGAANNLGGVYRLTLTRRNKAKETVLYSFSPDNSYGGGYSPSGGLTMNINGNLYGAASQGGSTYHGVVYELSRAGHGVVETVLHSFCSDGGACADGAYPWGSLIIDAAGHLFGVTSDGGAGHGTVFEIAPSEARSPETVLYSFCVGGENCPDGAVPEGIALDANGTLFGFTLQGGTLADGTVFELQGTTETVLHSFCSLPDCRDGSSPTNNFPALDGHGNLFGTAQSGGGSGGGTAFELTP
jgi:uncharacterized repeat protein (TIGR03803 family)